ncbi:unnamed protein product, partial [marine sediment metagenome]
MSRKRTRKFVTIARIYYETALKAKLGGCALRFFYAFLRQSDGFEKDFDKKSWKRYTNLTGISKSHLSDHKKELIEKGYMYEKDSILYLEKDISKWGKFPKRGTLKKFPIQGTRVPDSGNKEFPVPGNTSEYSHLNIHNKGLSTSPGKKKARKVPEGLKKFMIDLKKLPGKKKK